jgi:MFS family permease
MIRALRYRNYRLFFGGQLISLIGTWMSMTASSWLVYRLSGSAWTLGLVGFASQFPAFLLTPVAGVLVDRWNRHRLLIVAQTFSMLQSFSLAYLTLTGRITIPAIIILNVAQGLINAFELASRQSFIVTVIENKEDLGNAIALNSSMFNAARLLGPSLAGFIVSTIGEGWCFFIDGTSFLAVIGALLAMKIVERRAVPRVPKGLFPEWKEGWSYAFGFTPIRAIIILLAVVSLAGAPYSVLIPIFAGQILGGGPHTLGFLMTASGLGALIAALWLASRKSVLGLGRALPISTAVFSVALVAFGWSRSVWLSLVLMLVIGMGFMVQIAGSNTILQTIVDDEKRGRVMSLFLMAFLGMMPLGSLLAGWLAEKIGAPSTMTIQGAVCAAAAIWFAFSLPSVRAAIRPIYIKMGILPDTP